MSTTWNIKDWLKTWFYDKTTSDDRYASKNHNQNLSTINNTTTVTVVVTYTDNTTETINLVKYTGS